MKVQDALFWGWCIAVLVLFAVDVFTPDRKVKVLRAEDPDGVLAAAEATADE